MLAIFCDVVQNVQEYFFIGYNLIQLCLDSKIYGAKLELKRILLFTGV